MTASVEEWRGELIGIDTLALAADPDVPDRHAAKVALGLNARAEPDGPGPHCGWCGRTSPAGGLEDQSLGGPQVHECVDSAGCQAARSQREGWWIDKQYKLWHVDLDKIRRVQDYERQMALKTQYGGGIYSLTDPLELAALSDIRAMADQRATGYEELFVRVGEQLELTAPSQPAAPEIRPEPVKFDPWGHTLAAAHNRTHLLGHHLQQKGVHDAASAMAHRDVQDQG